MDQELQPPPMPPTIPPVAPVWSSIALVLGLLALVSALPLLWWKLSSDANGVSMVADVVAGVTDALKGRVLLPDWYGPVRATSVMCAFLSLIFVVLALILKNRDQRAGIACVLALAALAVTAPWLTLIILGGLVALVVGLLSMGMM